MVLKKGIKMVMRYKSGKIAANIRKGESAKDR
jgi:hypothetical protein